MHRVSSRTSTKTGTAFHGSTAVAEAWNEKAGTKTSSPGATSKAPRPMTRPEVAELAETA